MLFQKPQASRKISNQNPSQSQALFFFRKIPASARSTTHDQPFSYISLPPPPARPHLQNYPVATVHQRNAVTRYREQPKTTREVKLSSGTEKYNGPQRAQDSAPLDSAPAETGARMHAGTRGRHYRRRTISLGGAAVLANNPKWYTPVYGKWVVGGAKKCPHLRARLKFERD